MIRNRVRWITGLVALTALTAFSRPSPARADDALDGLLKVIPADAWGFVAIPNLEELNNASSLIQKEIMGAPMMDMLQMMTMQLGIEKGLDVKAPAGVVVMDVKKFAEDPWALVVTTTAPDEYLANFAPKPEEAGVIPLEVAGEPGYAVKRGKIVMMGKNKDVITAVSKSDKSCEGMFDGTRRKMMGKRVLTAHVALGRIVENYKDEIPDILKGFAAMSGQMPGEESDADSKEMVDQLRQIECMDVCLGLDQAGLALSFFTVPVKGSKAEASAKALKTAPSLLKGLAAEKYVMAGGAMFPHDPETYKQIDKLVEGGLKSLPEDKPEIKKTLKELYGQVKDLIKTCESVAVCVEPLGEGADGLLALSKVVTTSDSGKLMEGIGKLKESVDKLGEQDEEAKEALGMVVYKKGAETIGGIKVDHLAIDPVKAGMMDDDEMGTVRKILGKDGFAVRMGACDAKHVAATLGGGEKQFAGLAKSAVSAGSPLASEKGIAMLGKELPAERTMELYIDVDSAARLFKSIAKAMEESDPIPSVPDIDAPIALVASVDGAVGRGDMIVPMEVIRGIRGMVMGAMQAGQGQGGPGGDSDAGMGGKPDKADADQADDGATKSDDMDKSSDSDDEDDK